LDGVSDRDYESHVQKYHVNSATNKGAAEPKWSVFSAAQNLPAVLNDPSRGKQTNFFTKKWGDSFIERTSIPTTPLLADIKWNHFDTYLKKIGKRYRRHERYAKMIRNEGDGSPVSPPPRQLPHDSPTEGSLKDIPDIFMKSEVELWNPSTFVQVFPGIGGTDGVPTTNYVSGRLLQEKLSHYLDIVEVQIAKQVCKCPYTHTH
jgi:vacuolar protein sorting-associated protein 54